MNDAMRRKYMAVLSSPRWRWMKRRIIEVRGNKCEGCGESGGQLDLHHDTYERLGSEKPSDVRLLCRDCHRTEDILRAERGKQKSDDAYYWACVDGFMTRRCGDDWEASFDECTIGSLEDILPQEVRTLISGDPVVDAVEATDGTHMA